MNAHPNPLRGRLVAGLVGAVAALTLAVVLLAVTPAAYAADGAFDAKVLYPAGDQPQAVAIADFNGDGHPDLAVAASVSNSVSNSVAILLGAGGGAAKAVYRFGHALEGYGEPCFVNSTINSRGLAGLRCCDVVHGATRAQGRSEQSATGRCFDRRRRPGSPSPLVDRRRTPPGFLSWAVVHETKRSRLHQNLGA
jgi:hypothetical protein